MPELKRVYSAAEGETLRALDIANSLGNFPDDDKINVAKKKLDTITDPNLFWAAIPTEWGIEIHIFVKINSLCLPKQI